MRDSGGMLHFLRDRLAGRRARHTGNLVPVGMPAPLPILPQPRHVTLSDGHKIAAAAAIQHLGDFAPALRMMDGGLTLSGGEPLLQPAFAYSMFAAAKGMGLHTALDTSGLLGSNADDGFLEQVDLVLLDIKSWDPDTSRTVTSRDVAPTLASPNGWRRWASRSGFVSCWCRGSRTLPPT